MNYETVEQIYTPKQRMSGILLHPTSLPSPYGVGDLGQGAYDFVDFLANAGQHLWQVLPLTHTGFGNSPYQSFSAFAGQPLLISPEHLVELELLTFEDIQTCPYADDANINDTNTDYECIIPWKEKLFILAYERYQRTSNNILMEEYDSFYKKNAFWLDDYCLFMACKSHNNGACWLDWDAHYKSPDKTQKQALRTHLHNEISFYAFIQFIFFKEWHALKQYANQHHIQIIGDIPIFVSMDSADVWSQQHLFDLDANGYPCKVSGVPPDYFSSTGQLWGNPLYKWETHKAEGYAWWIRRIQSQLDIFDLVRIDHFRGFESYWEIPYGDDTAINGTWRAGPKDDLFRAITTTLGENLPIIAEDLGIITPEVEKLRDKFQFPGMKVLQFAFEGMDESTFLPHHFHTPHCVCYTGTHDNDTTFGWYQTISEEARDKIRRYMNTNGHTIHLDFIRTCLGSIATYAIFPLQDVLGLDSTARMNTPGVATNNWKWRYKKEMLTNEVAAALKELTILYGRYEPPRKDIL